MNRCPPALQGFSLGLMTLLLTLVTLAPEPLAAQGLLRQFPAAANILINGQPERLSPGARIKNANNIIVLSGSLVGQAVLDNYRRDPQGQVHEVWLLSPAEAQQKRAGMETLTNFVVGSDADKPRADDGKTPFNQLPGFQQC